MSEAVIKEALDEVQRNAVPVINRLIAEANAKEETRVRICAFEPGCESCQ